MTLTTRQYVFWDCSTSNSNSHRNSTTWLRTDAGRALYTRGVVHATPPAAIYACPLLASATARQARARPRPPPPSDHVATFPRVGGRRRLTRGERARGKNPPTSVVAARRATMFNVVVVYSDGGERRSGDYCSTAAMRPRFERARCQPPGAVIRGTVTLAGGKCNYLRRASVDLYKHWRTFNCRDKPWSMELVTHKCQPSLSSVCTTHTAQLHESNFQKTWPL